MIDLIKSLLFLTASFLLTLGAVSCIVEPAKLYKNPPLEANTFKYETSLKKEVDFGLKKEIEDFQASLKNFWESLEETKPYDLSKKFNPLTGQTILEIDFLRSVEEVSGYAGLIDEIQSLKAGDIIIAKFSNFGGSVYTGAALFNALTATEAKVHAIVEAPSFSMGAMLPCAADTIELLPFSFLMYHDYSGRMVGKGSEMREQLKGFDTIVYKMLDQCVKHGILTEKEKFDIKDGKDIYKHPEDFK